MTEDAVLAGLIVRNIGDIEAALNQARDELDKRFLEEIRQAAEISSDQIWDVEFDKDHKIVRLIKQEWLTGKGREFSLDFDELEGDGEEGDWTWIAAATASGPNGGTLGLFFRHNFTEARFKRLLDNNPELTALLCKHGFERDASKKQLFIRTTIDREDLAQAFEKEDFDVALEPIQTAVKTASAAVQALDELVRVIRSHAVREPPPLSDGRK